MTAILCRFFACSALLMVGCAGAGVRQLHVEPLGRYAQAKQVSVTVTGDAPEALKADLRAAFSSGLQAGTALHAVDAPDQNAYRAELHVFTAEVPAEQVPPAGRWQDLAGGIAARQGLGARGAGRLTFEAVLRAPDSDQELGILRYDQRGDAVALLEEAGESAGARLGREMVYRRTQFVRRRASDERLFLTPTPLTLERGEWVISNDELLLFRVGVGISRRVQLDAWLGGLPVYGPLGAGGAAALFGVLDLGIKVALLEEGRWHPGLSLAYDFVNVFGVGALGMAFPGGALVAASAGNAQFNLFSVATSKHFKSTHIVLGSYFLDNHHFVPQGSVFANQEGAATQSLDRVPLQVQPFLAIEQVLGVHASLAAEIMPRLPVRGTLGSAGVRWLLGGGVPRGPIAVHRVRFRIDLAAVVGKVPGGAVLIAPWLGLGLHLARKP